jgi:hypothetical protein
VARAAVLWDFTTPAGIGQFAVIQSVAPSVGMEVSPINMRDAAETERAVAGLRARTEWRSDRDVERGGTGSAFSDRQR